MNRVMVISPHPDDESIGCGGTVLKHVAEGDLIHVELLTSGEKGGHGRSEDETAIIREAEAAAAAVILGVAHVEYYRQPDGGLRVTRALASRLASRIEEWRPHTIYVPHPAEQHADHQMAFRLLRRSLSSQNVEELPRVLAYEVWTPLQQLDEIVDITPYLPKKLKAIGVYKSQAGIMNFEAAARGLARYRGEMHCWPGGEYAEVFADCSKIACRPLQQHNERSKLG
jgi:N-acetylglucosamine malate deacetylase 1